MIFRNTQKLTHITGTGELFIEASARWTANCKTDSSAFEFSFIIIIIAIDRRHQ